MEEECASLRHLDKPTVDPDSVPRPELEERCAQLERMVNELQEQIGAIKEENERLMSRSVAEDTKEKEVISSFHPSARECGLNELSSCLDSDSESNNRRRSILGEVGYAHAYELGFEVGKP